jgi:hypothetical protein
MKGKLHVKSEFAELRSDDHSLFVVDTATGITVAHCHPNKDNFTEVFEKMKIVVRDWKGLGYSNSPSEKHSQKVEQPTEDQWKSLPIINESPNGDKHE